MMRTDKPCIFITSGSGRTATQFFASKLPQMIRGCVGVHEADVVWLTRPQQWLPKLLEFGLLRMTVGRFCPRYSVRTLSMARHRRVISDDRTKHWLCDLRGAMVAQSRGGVFLEANAQFYGVVDLVAPVFPSARVVFVIRDPRDWVRSYMNFSTGMHSLFDLRSWVPNARLTARNLPGDPLKNRWQRMTRFERLCWTWATENAFGTACAARTDSARVYRFEDLFISSEREAVFREMLDFVTRFPNGDCAEYSFDPGVLANKVHSKASGPFPKWREWEDDYAIQLHRHCGQLMERFGYGTEPEWRGKIRC